jgi:hypothetical protein
MVQTMDMVGYAAWPSPYPAVTGGAVAEGMPQASSPSRTCGSSSRTNWAKDGYPRIDRQPPGLPRTQAASSRACGMSADAALEGGDA